MKPPARSRGGRPLLRLEDRRRFIKELSKSGSVTQAAKVVGFSPSTLAQHRVDDRAFDAAWHEAIEAAADTLELEARRRAVDGVEKPIFWQGEEVGSVREYSDSLLQFLLKGNKPDKFRDRASLDVAGSPGRPLEIKVVYEGGEGPGPAAIAKLPQIPAAVKTNGHTNGNGSYG